MAFVNPVLPYLYSITLLGPLNMEMTLADRVDKVIHIIHLEVYVGGLNCGPGQDYLVFC